MNAEQPHLPDTTPDLANLSERELSSNQEARVVPWIAGERKVAATWITPINNLFSKKVPRAPNGIEDAFAIAMWFDVGAATLSGFDSLIKDATQPKNKFWYGTVAGVVCAGPVDELVGLLINGKTVWPGTKVWADGIIDLPSLQRKRTSNKAHVYFENAHGITHSSKFIISGLADASFNRASATAVTNHSDTGVEYTSVGANVALVDDVGGRLTKVVHYTAGDVVRDGASVWVCILTHDGMPATRPPNATYWASYSVLRAGAPNPYPFTVSGFGQAYFYWGTSGQTLDAGEAALTQLGHPPYRNQAVIVLKDFLLGSTRSAAPSIELVVRRKPVQTVITGASANLDGDSQANGLAVLADMLAHPVFGLGQAAGLLDATSWQAIADAAAAAADRVYISPFIDRAVNARAFVALVMAYHDGWLRFNAAGAIEAGKFSHNEAPPAFTAATTIDFHDCIEEITFDSDGWASTFNETVVKFQDRARAFKDASLKHSSGLNRAIVGEPRQAVVDRLYMTREAQALAHAAEWGKINATPKLAGTLVVRAEKASSVKQGDLFKLTHDAVGLSVVCRCVEKILAAPPAGRATLRFESERGIAPIPYSPTSGGPDGTILPPAGKVTLYRFFQPPPLLVGTGDFRIACLIARTSSVAHGVNLYFKLEDGGSFYQLGQTLHFAVNGTLAANYPAASPTMGIITRSRVANYAYMRAASPALTWDHPQSVVVSGVGGTGYNGTVVASPFTIDPGVFGYSSAGPDEGTTSDVGGTVTPSDPTSTDDDSEALHLTLDELTVPVDLEGISETQTADAISDDSLLVILVSNLDPTQFEVLTLKSIRLDAGVYKLKVRRGRFGTLKRAFLVGDNAWIIHRNQITAFNHSQFGDYAQSGSAATFRLQSFTATDSADLSDANLCPDIAFNFADPYAPQIAWPVLQYRRTSNRPPVDWPPNYTDAFADLGPTATVSLFGQFRFTMKVTSPAGLLSMIKLIARYSDGTEMLLLAKSFEPSATVQVTAICSVYGVAPMQFPAPGPPTFIAVIGDWNRRTTEHVVPVEFTWHTPI